MRAVLVLAASSAVASAVAATVGTYTEHVALGPAAGKSTTLEFATVSYPAGHSATTADQVTVEAAEDGLDVLGDWQDMELGNVSDRAHAACLACLLASVLLPVDSHNDAPCNPNRASCSPVAFTTIRIMVT